MSKIESPTAFQGLKTTKSVTTGVNFLLRIEPFVLRELPQAFLGVLLNFSFLPSGSPADKTDLEVADEILEINGETLENSTHTDVITHIHNVSRISL